jgi:uncharacterized damage-inducible protein DinB
MTKDGLERLLDYTVWANHRAMRTVATLSVAEFRRDLGGSFGGVRGTLTHTLGAEWIWLERWKGVSPSKPPFDEGEFKDIVAVRERWKVVEDHRASWFRALKQDDVRKLVRYKNLAGQSFEAPLWQLVQHVANHSTYHRGQVVAFLRQLGAKPQATDMVVWDRKPKK